MFTNVESVVVLTSGVRVATDQARGRRTRMDFSAGKLSREAAMAALGVDDRALLDRMAAAGLPLFRVSAGDAAHMSEEMAALLLSPAQ